jgi:hypothetical protein
MNDYLRMRAGDLLAVVVKYSDSVHAAREVSHISPPHKAFEISDEARLLCTVAFPRLLCTVKQEAHRTLSAEQAGQVEATMMVLSAMRSNMAYRRGVWSRRPVEVDA